jgi:hypothetical protein
LISLQDAKEGNYGLDLRSREPLREGGHGAVAASIMNHGGKLCVGHAANFAARGDVGRAFSAAPVEAMATRTIPRKDFLTRRRGFFSWRGGVGRRRGLVLRPSHCERLNGEEKNGCRGCDFAGKGNGDHLACAANGLPNFFKAQISPV